MGYPCHNLLSRALMRRAMAAPGGSKPMNSCGAELSEDAVVPEQLAALMAHVAENMEAHALWVGTTSVEARAEHDGLLELAADYRRIAAAARQAVASMRRMRDLAPAAHDMARWDRHSFMHWMQKKIELQRSFAQLLLEHAEASERIVSGQAVPSVDE
jgi:hypothetical protein